MLDRRLPNNERIKVVNNATAGHRSPCTYLRGFAPRDCLLHFGQAQGARCRLRKLKRRLRRSLTDEFDLIDARRTRGDRFDELIGRAETHERRSYS